MEPLYTVARPIEGITLNGVEYLLDDGIVAEYTEAQILHIFGAKNLDDLREEGYVIEEA